ncbi:MAG TPA: zinc ribbon domain-containing protein [Ignavibacteriaceae bacterium]|nr:zinc ribbon domain-containing protein [Ignavibacteriaceae bacterium]
MPTYDYKCLSCSYKFEVFQSMNSKLIEECPKCGGKVKRLIGAGSGPIFKGKGFYQTDYKNPTKSGSEPTKSVDKKTSGESSKKNATEKK